MRTLILGFMGLAIGMLAPSEILAQACQGSPAPRGHGVVMGSASFTDGGNSFGPTLGGNFEGPVFGSASYSYTDLDGTDETQHGLGARIGAEYLTETDLSLCLDGRVSHLWITNFDIDGQVFGGNASIGYAAGNGEVKIIPHGSIGVTHATANVGAFEGSDTAALLSGGVTVGSESVFVGGSVSYATFEDSDAVFGVGAGIVF